MQNHLADLQKILKDPKMKNFVYSGAYLPLGNEWEDIAKKSLYKMNKAVPFNLGYFADAKEFYDIKSNENEDILKLPFPVIWIEFKTKNPFALELKNSIDFKHSCFLAYENGSDIEVVYFEKDGKKWGMYADATLVGGLNCKYCKCLPEMTAEIDLTQFILKHFVNVLNCENIKAIEHKVPKNVQKERAGHDQLPMKSTWTLAIKPRFEMIEQGLSAESIETNPDDSHCCASYS